jgi:hypothetical protein
MCIGDSLHLFLTIQKGLFNHFVKIIVWPVLYRVSAAMDSLISTILQCERFDAFP